MDRVNINTVQNVEIENKIAGIGDRILAFLIDSLVIIGYFLFLGLVNVITGILDDMVVMYIVMILPLMFYNLISETFFNGQNFGKRVMKIKVVKLDGTQARFYHYFVRWVFRLVDVLLFTGAIGMLVIIINKKGQRFGDIAAGTTVVRIKYKDNIANTIYVELKDEYKPLYTNVQFLKEKDINTINKVYKHIKVANKTNENILLAYNTKTKVEKAIKEQTQMPPVPFLEQVLKDYNYYNKN